MGIIGAGHTSSTWELAPEWVEDDRADTGEYMSLYKPAGELLKSSEVYSGWRYAVFRMGDGGGGIIFEQTRDQ